MEPLLRREDASVDDTCERPFSAELAYAGTLPTTAITKMGMLAAHGWPGARAAMIDRRGKRIVVRPDDGNPEIWELKAKPSCWRLYFYVLEKSSAFVFLVAICKKARKGNEATDAAEARRRLARLRGHSGDALIEFEFPPR